MSRRYAALLSLLLLSASPALADVDRIVVTKAERKLRLFDGGTLVREYDIRLGSAPEGRKQVEGDGRTPEGLYRISGRNAASAYTLSLRISYPEPWDLAAAVKRGLSPGGDIMIHGQPDALPDFVTLPWDWTAGCIAVSNDAIREIWSLAPDGTAIEIRP
ncbi:L,D-transpeptidase family protein [Zavarzinia sp.]|uniref:L,D-transpeptidase family protein n=1 Tax=Zavarzinia sp. TaxID=2027920 RepID=UPI003BB6038B